MHFRKLGFTPDGKVYHLNMLKHFHTKSSHTYCKCDCSVVNREEMHIVALLIESNAAIAATQMNKLNGIFCISLGWFNNAISAKKLL